MRRNRGKREREVTLKKRVIMTVLSIMMLFGIVMMNGVFASAHGNQSEVPVEYSYYKSIQIQPGDTLWEIAETYVSGSEESIRAYVEELKQVNQLPSDFINDCQYLTVRYTSTDFH